MQFKEWVQLTEMQHISLPRHMQINNITTDAIDFRFEDWGRGYNPSKHTTFKAPPQNAKIFLSGSFSAPINSGYLNVSQPSTGTQGNLALNTKTNTRVVITPQPAERTLPAQWFDFAVFYLGNRVVKTPEWPRDASEQGTMATVNW